MNKGLGSEHRHINNVFENFTALKCSKGEAPTFSRQSAHRWRGKVVSPTRRPLFTAQEDSWYSFLLEAELTPGP
jgi:hypothetical protein